MELPLGSLCLCYNVLEPTASHISFLFGCVAASPGCSPCGRPGAIQPPPPPPAPLPNGVAPHQSLENFNYLSVYQPQWSPPLSPPLCIPVCLILFVAHTSSLSHLNFGPCWPICTVRKWMPLPLVGLQRRQFVWKGDCGPDVSRLHCSQHSMPSHTLSYHLMRHLRLTPLP